MAAPVTEVTIVPLKKNVDLRVKNSEAAKTLDRLTQKASVQPGFQRLIWGLDKKDPTVLFMIVDWDDLDSHHKFMNAPYYKALMDDFMTLVAGTIVLFHTTYEQGLGFAPLVGLKDYTADVSFAFFHARSVTQDFQDDLTRDSRAVNTGLLESNEAPSRIASGWCIEDALYEERPGKGSERPWMSMVAWKDKETRQRAWERNAVLGDIPRLVKGKGELEIYEVEFQPVILG